MFEISAKSRGWSRGRHNQLYFGESGKLFLRGDNWCWCSSIKRKSIPGKENSEYILDTKNESSCGFTENINGAAAITFCDETGKVGEWQIMKALILPWIRFLDLVV